MPKTEVRKAHIDLAGSFPIIEEICDVGRFLIQLDDLNPQSFDLRVPRTVKITGLIVPIDDDVF